MKYSFRGNRTLIVGEQEIKFPHQIYEVMDFDTVVVVDISSGGDSIDMAKEPNNNIYAVTDQGKILWNIMDVMSRSPLYKGEVVDGYYKILKKIDACHIKLWSFMGLVLTINVFTGIVTELEARRF